MTTDLARHEQLRHAIERLILVDGSTRSGHEPHLRPGVEVDVVVTPNEINDKHGTGVLVKRVFAGCGGIFSVRTRDDYGGDHSFGEASCVLSHAGVSRAEAFRNTLIALKGRSVRRIVCVPYVRDDLLTSIALKEIFGAPLCIWIMDDQNIATDGIPDAIMREGLEKSSLRLTTHPEMRQAYEKKYGLRFWLLPAVAPAELVTERVEIPQGPEAERKTGALVGSVWSQQWLDHLCRVLTPTSLTTDWYGNDKSPYFQVDRESLDLAGVRACGILPEPELATALRAHPFAIVPTGTLNDDTGHARTLAELSLPGRILFIAATSHTPVIVLGNERTPASHFVARFGIGVTAPYDPDDFRHAVDEVTKPEVQARMRRNAAAIARKLAANDIGEWIWGSLKRGEPVDMRFEDLLPRSEEDLVAFIEAPVPSDIHREYVAIYHALRRLQRRGMRLDFIVDVGASMGIWSFAASKLFPDARFIMLDPLASRYDRTARHYHADAVPHGEMVEAAVSNRVGRTTLNVPPDLYGASLLQPADFRSYEPLEVPVTTVDQLARERGLKGRGLLKADVQCAEHLVLEGSRDTLPRIDVLVLELSLVRYHEEARTFLEMLNLLDECGFRYFDDAGCWRSPVDGTLLQKDVIFVRRELFPALRGEATPSS